MEVLSVKNLSFKYDNGEFSLRDISFTLEAGEIMLLSGPSGSGKSTLLRLLKEEIRPNGKLLGEVSLGVGSVQVGFMFQNPEAQIVCQTVKEELVFGAENLGMKKDVMRRLLAEITAYLGIEELLDKKTSELSLGQKQLVNLASVLMMKPKVLLLDEPVASLDVVAGYDFLKLITKLRDEMNIAVIMIEHNIGSIMGEVSKVLYLEEGVEVFAGVVSSFKDYLFENDKAYYKTLPECAKLYKEAKESEGEKGGFDIPVTVKELVNALSEDELKFILKKPVREAKESESILEIKSGYFRYDKAGKDVIKNINLKIKRGVRLALLGGNGAGKSTLFSVLSGYRKLYKGKVKGGEQAVVLPQNSMYAFSEDTVIEDLKLVKSEAEIKEYMDKYPLFDDLRTHLNDNPLDLSGGQMRKAAILKLLLTDAEIILMDEPVTGLDGMDKENLGSIVMALSEMGKTLVFISHDLEWVEDYAEECAFLYNGEIISTADASEFFVDNRFYTTVKGRLLADGDRP